MKVVLADFDGPGLGFGLGLFPKFCANEAAGPGCVAIDTSLKAVPDVRLNVERNGFLHSLVIAGHFKDSAVARKRHEVTLVDQADREPTPRQGQATAQRRGCLDGRFGL